MILDVNEMKNFFKKGLWVWTKAIGWHKLSEFYFYNLQPLQKQNHQWTEVSLVPCGSISTVHISPLAHSKSFEGFFFLRGEAIASVVKNVTKPLYLRRTRWAAGEPRALQGSSWAKSLPWHCENNIVFFTRQYWAGSVTASESRDRTDLLFQPWAAPLQTLPSGIVFMHIISISLM